MPSTLTYPGVYVEEIPSSVRAIAGLSTSDTAFIDFFPRGPLHSGAGATSERPVRVTSFEEFSRVFGGLDTRSPGSYAIAQYFMNGGAVAWVARAAESVPGTPGSPGSPGPPPVPPVPPVPAAPPAPSTLTLRENANPVVAVEAANPGEWGRKVRVTVDLPTTGLFSLRVREYASTAAAIDTSVVTIENHRNLSMDPAHARYAPSIVNAASALIRVVSTTGTMRPTALQETALQGGADGQPPTALAPLQEAMNAFDRIAPAVFNLMCLPGATTLADAVRTTVYDAAIRYCEDRRAFLIMDIPEGIDFTSMQTLSMSRSANAAVYFPRVTVPDPLANGLPRNIPASGTVAGIYARTDAARGVWKAPAGTDAGIRGASLVRDLSDLDDGVLNVLGVNVLRSFPIYGSVVWGARTLRGSDAEASEWKYVPVRRIALHIEGSLMRGLKWVVFEPNDEPLWSSIRLNVGSFMNGLFRQGAFAGLTPREAYFVKCDKDTTTPADQDLGVVNIIVGFRPLKPAEFVVLKIQQIAGQAAV
jgi:phage tail sheath protein FI